MYSVLLESFVRPCCQIAILGSVISAKVALLHRVLAEP